LAVPGLGGRDAQRRNTELGDVGCEKGIGLAGDCLQRKIVIWLVISFPLSRVVWVNQLRTSAERRRSYTLGVHGYRRFSTLASSTGSACIYKNRGLGIVGGGGLNSRRAELAEW